MPIKFISVNIEEDKHLDKIEALFLKEKPDVVCLQEINEPDLPFFERLIGRYSAFSPMFLREPHGTPVPSGVAIVSRLPLEGVAQKPYAGNTGELQLFDSTSEETMFNGTRFTLLLGTVEMDDEKYRIGVTHFVWTPDGSITDFQRIAGKGLFAHLDQEGDMIFCGDLNAPRGQEMFTQFTDRYTDVIPEKYSTTLDKNLHRVKSPKFEERNMHNFVVDGLLISENYHADDVRLEFGVSDHAAVVATLSKADALQ